VPRPILNLDELAYVRQAHGDRFEAQLGPIAARLGARQLGARLTILPPGKRAFPFHCHHANEELFLVLSGSGTLRYGVEEHALRAGDLVLTPAGGRETAHQIVNTGDAELRFLCVSTMVEPDVCEYPDSGKFAVLESPKPGSAQKGRTWAAVRDSGKVDYWEGE
jgi:uncharacterized cupin superfamily protein